MLTFALAALALTAAPAAAQATQLCENDVIALQSCSSGLAGSALGAACCPRIQALMTDCDGIYGVQRNLLGNFQYLQYWSTLISALETGNCPRKPSKLLVILRGPPLAPKGIYLRSMRLYITQF